MPAGSFVLCLLQLSRCPAARCIPSFSHRVTESTGAQLEEQLNFITGAIVSAAVRIHQKLGPGLLESVYEVILARDLSRAGFFIERQKPISFEFEGTLFHDAFRPDLIVNRLVVVELKATRVMDPVCERQLLTYLRALDLRLGLVLNFGMTTMKAGIRRIAN